MGPSQRRRLAHQEDGPVAELLHPRQHETHRLPPEEASRGHHVRGHPCPRPPQCFRTHGGRHRTAQEPAVPDEDQTRPLPEVRPDVRGDQGGVLFRVLVNGRGGWD